MSQLMILVTYTMKQGMREAFIREVTDSGILEQIRMEEGCLGYNYYRAVEDDNRLLLVEKWVSQEHQEMHLQQPHIEDFKEIKERFVIDTQLEKVLF